MLLTFLRSIWCLRNSWTFICSFETWKKKILTQTGRTTFVPRTATLYPDMFQQPVRTPTSHYLLMKLQLDPGGKYFLLYSPWYLPGKEKIQLSPWPDLLSAPSPACPSSIPNPKSPRPPMQEPQLSSAAWFVNLHICTCVVMWDLPGLAHHFPSNICWLIGNPNIWGSTGNSRKDLVIHSGDLLSLEKLEATQIFQIIPYKWN